MVSMQHGVALAGQLGFFGLTTQQNLQVLDAAGHRAAYLDCVACSGVVTGARGGKNAGACDFVEQPVELQEVL